MVRNCLLADLEADAVTIPEPACEPAWQGRVWGGELT